MMIYVDMTYGCLYVDIYIHTGTTYWDDVGSLLATAGLTSKTWVDPSQKHHIYISKYPLVNVYITMGKHNFSWENSLFLW